MAVLHARINLRPRWMGTIVQRDLKAALALARLTQINREIAARFIHYSVRIASTIHDSALPRQFKGLHDKDPARSQFATRDFVSEPSRLRRPKER
jgi:hypothetical protein